MADIGEPPDDDDILEITRNPNGGRFWAAEFVGGPLDGWGEIWERSPSAYLSRSWFKVGGPDGPQLKYVYRARRSNVKGCVEYVFQGTLDEHRRQTST